MPSLLQSRFAIIFIFFSLFSSTLSVDIATTSSYRAGSTTVKRGVVAADDHRCSRVGRNILREGGHAVDACVATALCLGVVSPGSSGIGGGALMLVRLANGEAQVFDMRETAPKQASQQYVNARLPVDKATGPLSIAVPGELAGLYRAWKQHGKLPWSKLVRPAEQLARNGFTISLYLYKQMVRRESSIKADKGLRSIFTSPAGTLFLPGNIIRNQNLANTLAEVSKYRVEAFYNGSVGNNLVKDVKNAGGILTMEDLQNYGVKLRKPISTNFQGFKILGIPPPSSGGATMILMLNILTQYGLPSGVSGPLGIHRTIEAMKHATAVRMNLGDPDFVNVSSVLSAMLSPSFAAELKKTINDNKTFGPSYYGGRWNQIHDHGTSHISIVDSERNAVSMTTSINSYFGSQILSPTTGIVLNNQMLDFSYPGNHYSNHLPPAPANFVRPFKRPLSSMAPTIVVKGRKLKAVIGAAGGVLIAAATTEVLLNHISRGMNPLSSVIAPRLYHLLMPNVLYYENMTSVSNVRYEVPAATVEALKKKGHVLQPFAGATICQFVVQMLDRHKAGKLVAVSDPRKGGEPAGY